MNFHHSNRFLSPEPLNGGEGGGAGGSGAPAVPAPAFDASQYVPKAEFDRISNDYNEFRQTAEQRFQDYDSRLPKPAKVEPSEDKEPDAESGEYNFQKPGEFQRYQRDLTNYHLRKNLSERESKQNEEQREASRTQYVQSLQDAHATRADSFRAANPDYDPNKSIKVGHDTVTLAILDSDYSAHIHNYLQKNPEKLSELRGIISSKGPGAGVRYVGRLETMFENKAVPGLPAAKPTKAAFGGGAAKASQRSQEEIVKDWRM
jgi:hypothetical protein